MTLSVFLKQIGLKIAKLDAISEENGKSRTMGNRLCITQVVPVLEYFFNIAVPNTNEKLKSV